MLAGAALLAAGLVQDPSEGSEEPLKVSDVRLTTTPSNGLVRCPSAHLVLRALLATNGRPGTLALRWTRPDGVLSPVSHLPVPAGQRTITTELRFDLTGLRPLAGRALLHLLSPTPQDLTSVEVRYRC